MQIVIEIDDCLYNQIFSDAEIMYTGRGCGKTLLATLLRSIRIGTPLPKGHGRLKDIDEIDWYGCTTEYDCPYKNRDCKDCDRAECSKTQVDSIPTIIPADKGDAEWKIK